MNKKLVIFSLIVILALVLSGCQAATTANAAGPQGTPPAGFGPRPGSAAAATATPAATATAKPTVTATATAQPVSAGAEATVKAYFDALVNKDFSAAAQYVSVYSLSYAQLTRSDAAGKLLALSKAGATWSDLQVLDSQLFSDGLVLVHVTYRINSSATATPTVQASAAKTPATDVQLKDELWPVRLEAGQWLYNWNNLVDTRTVSVQSQTTEHITIKPTQLVRYSDRIELHFEMQNQTGDVVYFNQPYDSLAVFHFGDKAVEADKTLPVVISGLRTSFNEVIVVKGLYPSFPTWVEIHKWSGYVPNPWFSFQF
jgi:hypothetical protein